MRKRFASLIGESGLFAQSLYNIVLRHLPVCTKDRKWLKCMGHCGTALPYSSSEATVHSIASYAETSVCVLLVLCTSVARK